MNTLKVDITKKIGKITLRSRFEVSGDRFALLGSSGSGKTMTLKCIAGIEKPDSGLIALGDKVLFDSSRKINLPARKRNVGYLFQDYALFPNMTAFDNINIISGDRLKTMELLERFNIADVADHKPSQMSGGQCQRTALARMIASDPEIILLDEPFSALDNYMSTIIEREIMDLLETFDGPSVLVSHDRNEVYRMCDTIGVMDMGELTEVKPRDEFFDDPTSVVAARLTGCKNISAVDDSGFASDWGIRVTLPAGSTCRYIGYRAHYLERVGKEMNGEANVFDAKVERVIEDTFETAVCFRQRDNDSSSPDSLLTWMIRKEDVDEMVKASSSGNLFLKIDPGHLMLLER